MDATLRDEVTAALSPGYRCVAPTLPLGTHRRATKAGTDLSLPGIAKLVAEFLHRLGLDDVTLVGNDTSGARRVPAAECSAAPCDISSLVAARPRGRAGATCVTSRS